MGTRHVIVHQSHLQLSQAKVGDARATTGGELQAALLAAVAENERLNSQLHGLHTSAGQLRQAIADARSLQMHLQQEAADARAHLAVSAPYPGTCMTNEQRLAVESSACSWCCGPSLQSCQQQSLCSSEHI